MGTSTKVKQFGEKYACIFFLFDKFKFDQLQAMQNLLLLQRLTRHNLHIAYPIICWRYSDDRIVHWLHQECFALF